MRLPLSLLAFALLLLFLGCPAPPVSPPKPITLADFFQPYSVQGSPFLNPSTVCRRLGGFEQSVCLEEAAVAYRETAICEKVNVAARDRCYRDIAFDTFDEAYCAPITAVFTRNACYKTLALLAKRPMLCNYLTIDGDRAQLTKDDCFRSLAIDLKDASLCERVRPNTQLDGELLTIHDNCYLRLIRLTANTELCNYITAKELPLECGGTLEIPPS